MWKNECAIAYTFSKVRFLQEDGAISQHNLYLYQLTNKLKSSNGRKFNIASI